MNLEPSLTVAELLGRWPEAAPVFFAHKLGCVGCTMAPFDTLADVAKNYGLVLEAFIGALEQAIASAPPPSAT